MLKLMLKLVFYNIILLLAIVLYPWPIDFNPQPHNPEFRPLMGPLAENDLLIKHDKLYKGQLVGPESLEIHNDVIYTGIHGGKIVKIDGYKMKTLAKIGTDCEGMWDQEKCGRPLGLRLTKDGKKLYVVDAYYGLHVIDTSTGYTSLLVARGTEVDGRKLNLLNDIAIDEEGEAVYFTDSSTKYPLTKILWSIVEHENSGRVMKYDLKTRKTSVVLDGVRCANGIQLSHDKQALLISELARSRILKHHLRGPKAGQTDVFVDKLPGEPDNIRASQRGGYWIAFANGRPNGQHLFDKGANFPFLRLALMRLLYATGQAVNLVARFVNSPSIRELAARFDNGWVLYDYMPSYGLVVEVNAAGEIIRSLHDPTGKFHFISEVMEHDGYLYLGSFANDFIGRVKL